MERQKGEKGLEKNDKTRCHFCTVQPTVTQHPSGDPEILFLTPGRGKGKW